MENKRKNIPSYSSHKFINTFLYLIEKTAGLPNICEKGLFGRLYLVDYNYYEIYESHLSSSKYFKRSNYPLPDGIDKIIQQLIENEYLVRVKIKLQRLIPPVR